MTFQSWISFYGKLVDHLNQTELPLKTLHISNSRQLAFIFSDQVPIKVYHRK